MSRTLIILLVQNELKIFNEPYIRIVQSKLFVTLETDRKRLLILAER